MFTMLTNAFKNLVNKLRDLKSDCCDDLNDGFKKTGDAAPLYVDPNPYHLMTPDREELNVPELLEEASTVAVSSGPGENDVESAFDSLFGSFEPAKASPKKKVAKKTAKKSSKKVPAKKPAAKNPAKKRK